MPPRVNTRRRVRSSNIGYMLTADEPEEWPIARVWGGSESKDIDGRRVPTMPNPWPPPDIVALVKIPATVASLATAIYKLIKLWVDDRKARKVIIRKGDVSIEIHGGMSVTKIKGVFSQFRRLAKESDRSKIKVILPAGCDPKLPDSSIAKTDD